MAGFRRPSRKLVSATKGQATVRDAGKNDLLDPRYDEPFDTLMKLLESAR